MNPALLTAAGVCAWLLSGCNRPAVNQPVELTVRAEGKSAQGGFQVFLTVFPNWHVSHCRGTPIEVLEFSEATQPPPDGGAVEWNRVIDIGPIDDERADSLVICGFDDGRLTPVWHGLIQPAKGKRLNGVNCWIGDAFESDCVSGVLDAD
jgi:hypothetical protein